MPRLFRAKSVFFIHDSKAAYDLRGQRVGSPLKGIYVIDGKKVVIK